MRGPSRLRSAAGFREIASKRCEQPPVVQDGGGMVRGEERNPVQSPPAPPDPREGVAGTQEGAHRGLPHRDDDAGANRFHLGGQEVAARIRLLAGRSPVSRRAALHRVRDVHVVATDARGQEGPVQDLSGGPDEWLSLSILVPSRRLPDQHDPRRGRTPSRNRPRARPIKGTLRAARDASRESAQVVRKRVLGHGPRTTTRRKRFATLSRHQTPWPPSSIR